MKIHFLGIGGAGCSALASWLKEKGHQVDGCDLNLNERTHQLKLKGINVSQENSPDHITEDLDWLIFPNIANPNKVPEIAAAQKRRVKTSTYFEALGEITKDYFTIAIAGAHGKTTTTLMVKTILEKTGQDPNAIVGEGIHRNGQSNLFVVEACEYKRQFLSLRPDILVITNIAYDHPDCYRNKNETAEAFIQLVFQMKNNSLVIGCTKDPLVKKVLTQAEKMGRLTQEYGQELKKFRSKGWQSKSVIQIDKTKLELKLTIPGKHNVLNALAAIKAAMAVGVNPKAAAKALTNFSGCPRRLEKIGKINRAFIINDYAHHPDQIKAVIKALKSAYPQKKLIIAFEPHQHERVWQLFDRFVNCWQGVDKLILLPIYYVKGRESREAVKKASSEKLKEAIVTQGTEVELVNNYQQFWNQLKKEAKNDCLIGVLSAGPVSNLLRQNFSKSNENQ